MKFRHYRNPKIADRLNAASRRWVNDSPENQFEKPKGLIPGNITKTLWTIVIMIAGSLILGSHDQAPLLLTLALPVIAAITLSDLRELSNQPYLEETSYLLPLSDQRIDQQIRNDWKKPLITGTIAAALFGASAGITSLPVISALKAGLTFWALLGTLSISANPRFSWIHQATIFGLGALCLIFSYSTTIQEFVILQTSWWPWYLAFDSWAILATCLLAGGLIAFNTRRFWGTISPFSRTEFYESWDGLSLDSLLDESIEGGPIEIPDETFQKPSKPRGLIEFLLWDKLSRKEQSLVKISGATQSNWLSGWVLTNLLVIALSWVIRQEWLIPPVALGAATVISIVFVGMFFLVKCPFLTAPHLAGMEIAPQTTACQYQTIPVGLGSLERIFWREGLIKWPLAALTISLGFTLFLEVPPPEFLKSAAFCFLNILPAVVLVNTSMFWHSSFEGWAPRSGRAASPIKLADGIILISSVISILLVLITVLPSRGQGLISTPMPALILLMLGLPYILILRALIRSYFKNPASDLMKLD